MFAREKKINWCTIWVFFVAFSKGQAKYFISGVFQIGLIKSLFEIIFDWVKFIIQRRNNFWGIRWYKKEWFLSLKVFDSDLYLIFQYFYNLCLNLHSKFTLAIKLLFVINVHFLMILFLRTDLYQYKLTYDALANVWT